MPEPWVNPVGAARRWIRARFPTATQENDREDELVDLDHLTHESGVLVPKLPKSAEEIAARVTELVQGEVLDSYHRGVFEPTIELWGRHYDTCIRGDYLRERGRIAHERAEQLNEVRRIEDELAATHDELTRVEEQIRAVHSLLHRRESTPRAHRTGSADELNPGGGTRVPARDPTASGSSTVTEQEPQ